MVSITREAIRKELHKVKGPNFESDIVSLGLLSEIFIVDGKVFFSITVPDGCLQEFESLRCTAEEVVSAMEGVKSVIVTLTAEKKSKTFSSQVNKNTTVHEPKRKVGGALLRKTPIEGVRHVLAVASGKGGVGKSIMAMNIALALQDAGFKTGLMDADIYGPSLPRLTGLVNQQPEMIHGKKLQPLEKFGLKLMSMGFLIEEEKPIVWRGPMVMAAVTQLLRDVLWGPLDVLVVDMPPGTGDTQLTLVQQAQLTGALIVSTPQDLALIDARKAIEMFMKVEVPILGVIENMSYFIAPDTGRRYDIFGYGGARSEAESRGIPFLAEVPLDPVLRSSSDDGVPIFVADPGGEHAQLYRTIIHQVKDKLS
ncbi:MULTISPECIES: Mrp/NBP35 family ATP-binding protein [unclassified Bartonella]|uniref:Mrp/NBP35 family ATP-binding protein n=1 Tax=unclassified Bartonella TaxID=2645622 RepID=UPI00099B1A77|nr:MULTISPECIES: Mrp/NBP35 family ATP-binding protein [unclassified Bartonella]AQX23303.1 ATP-binding protein involved in chromosome partitioning [Bartonella sp. 11B]AQX23394.1 ATP-binding protein involved in chromosome partitioning [Bartonella sp. 114]AQX25760.1 ATP-binding protein involved in chromosome partitioning [Bartonella sp. Coyote22sub2]